MTTPRPDDEELSDELRHEIYHALMDAQELHELSPAQARQLIAGRYRLDPARLLAIEDEARDRLW